MTIFSDIDLIIVQETKARFLDRLEPFYTQLDPRTDVDILVYTSGGPGDLESPGAPGFTGRKSHL